MKHHLLTATIFVVALTFYGIGMTGGASALFIVGAVCELWFWMRMREHRRNI